MTKLSLLDKLKILFDISLKSYVSIIALIILIAVGILFAKTNNKTKERNKNIYIFGTAIILALIIVLYFQSLSNMLDYMMNNLFIAIYFPNLAIYFAALIIMNIIIWISLFNSKTSEIIKRINLIIYIIINYFLVLILTTINKEKLDIFSQESIYKNNNARALIELSSVIFIIWIIYLVFYKIIIVYLKKDNKSKEKEVIIKEVEKKLPNNFEPIETPKLIYGNIPKQKENKLKIEQRAKEIALRKELELEEKIKELNIKSKELNIKRAELEKEKEKIKLYDSLLTIEDYKVLLKILKDQKNKKKNNQVDYREAQKQEIIRLEEERRESLRKEKERIRKNQEQNKNVSEIDFLFGEINKNKYI